MIIDQVLHWLRILYLGFPNGIEGWTLSMLTGGVCLVLGLLTPLAAATILGSMVFALALEIAQGSPFVARDPYLIPQGQYDGPNGRGEPPSWEKAFMYCLMLMTISVLGPGVFSLDALIFS